MNVNQYRQFAAREYLFTHNLTKLMLFVVQVLFFSILNPHSMPDAKTRKTKKKATNTTAELAKAQRIKGNRRKSYKNHHVRPCVVKIK